VDACLRIIEAARGTGVAVQAGHVERFNPAVIELGRLLASGWLSTVYSIASRRAGPFPPRIRDVGVTIDLATHDVDILSWIAGQRPARVYAETAQRIHASHEDLLFGLLHFPSGTTGFLDVNWLTPTKRRELLVVGEEGAFELDYLTQRLTFTKQPDVRTPTLIGGYAPTFAAEVREVVVGRGEPLAAQLESFLAVARGEAAPVVGAEDALWAVAIANGLLESAARRFPVELADVSAAMGAT
jgi:UDP-N-acetylglucosamine 3-dehydrogenase